MFYSRNKKVEVQTLITGILNNNCHEMKALLDSKRLDQQVNLTMAVVVIPMKHKHPDVENGFAATTKNFSANGISIVLDEPVELEKVLVGFHRDKEFTFIEDHAKHLSPLGGGFFQLGIEFSRIVPLGEHPELAKIDF